MTDDARDPAVSRRQTLTLGAGALAAGALGASALGQQGGDGGDGGDGGGQQGRVYRVTVANLTRGQPFTPPAVALHQPSVEVFSVGDAANAPTQERAENGTLVPLLDLIESTPEIRAAAAGGSPLVPEDDPADTGLPYYATLRLSADASATHLTFASMLIATNDGIVGLDTVALPEAVNESTPYYANGYDVGTEENTERFEDLVPPAKTLILGGEPEGTTETDSELATDGVIQPHPGIQGVGDLPPEVYDWREPAALVQVERIPPTATEPTTTTGTATETETGTETETETEEETETETETEEETGTETETEEDTETETEEDTETETETEEETETETETEEETETETGTVR